MRRTLSLLFLMSLASILAMGEVNTIDTLAGGSAQLSPAYLPQPTSAVRNSVGSTYIAGPALNTVFVVDAGGRMTLYAETGIAALSGYGAAATKAQLNFPSALALDKGNHLSISDQNNEISRSVDAQSQNITIRKESCPRVCEMPLSGCL